MQCDDLQSVDLGKSQNTSAKIFVLLFQRVPSLESILTFCIDEWLVLEVGDILSKQETADH